jgi:hypothetical protein
MKKSRFSKLIVILVVLLNITFTGTVLYIFLQTGREPSTLIAAWFGFTTGELWFLSSIKKTKAKVKKSERSDYYDRV